MKDRFTSACLFTALLSATVGVAAAVQLASPFGDHMVLQQGRPVPVWGTAAPGEKVTVEFAGQKRSTTTDADGHWRLDLRKLKASTEARLFKVTGSATSAPISLDDVLVGEVWLCGGQSNMERQLGLRSGQKPIIGWEKAVAAAHYPLIRQLYVQQSRSPSPKNSLTGQWTVCSPATVSDFTAVGYFFARDLHLARGVPVGIIHSSWGGTPAEAWTSQEGLKNFPEFADSLVQLDRVAADPAAAAQSHLGRLARWYRDNDPGSGDAPWSAPALDTAGWETMALPTMWEEAGHPGFDGVAWFRKSFDLPADWNGRDVVLKLGAIDDVDTTWVNGTEVGSTSLWTTPRVYRVSAAVLKPKGNVIAVRVLDTGGGGGLWDPKLPLSASPADGNTAPLSLNGQWLAKFSSTLVNTRRPPTDPSGSASAPTVLYNAMIAPLVPYAIRGVTFYQGEANADRARQYRTLFPALIADWRRLWGQGDFPFLFVQIAPFNGMGPEIREAQLIAWQNTKNTAMAVTIDRGDATDIHPADKEPVGVRLALAARALAHGEKLEYSGPIFARMNLEGSHVVLLFKHLGGGLEAQAGPLAGFTLAGADGVFHPAQAEIVGDTVVVFTAAVAKPVAVRYGWANVAAGNLFNRAGLPASPFRTDVD